jgi:hypothetical protein
MIKSIFLIARREFFLSSDARPERLALARVGVPMRRWSKELDRLRNLPSTERWPGRAASTSSSRAQPASRSICGGCHSPKRATNFEIGPEFNEFWAGCRKTADP